MATKYKPFLFERDFGTPEGRAARAYPASNDQEKNASAEEAEDVKSAEPEEPPAPTYSEEELENAKQIAYEEGRTDGLAQGRQEVQEEVDAHIAEVLEALLDQVSPLVEQQHAANEHSSALMIKIARDMFERLMPAYVDRHGDEEVIALIRQSVANLQDLGRINISVCPDIVEALEDRLRMVVQQSGFEGKLTIIADPDLASSDIKIDWGSGGAERSYDDIWNDISGAVDHALSELHSPSHPVQIENGTQNSDPDTQEHKTLVSGASKEGQAHDQDGHHQEGE